MRTHAYKGPSTPVNVRRSRGPSALARRPVASERSHRAEVRRILRPSQGSTEMTSGSLDEGIQRQTEGDAGCAGHVTERFRLRWAMCGGNAMASIERTDLSPGRTNTYRIGAYLTPDIRLVDIPCVDRLSQSRVIVAHCDRSETLYANPEQRTADEAQGCDGNVKDRFKLYSTMVATPREASRAIIGRRDQPETQRELYAVGDALNDYMILVDILPGSRLFENKVAVAHCEKIELLHTETVEPVSVDVDSNVPGKVTIFGNCEELWFQSEAGDATLDGGWQLIYLDSERQYPAYSHAGEVYPPEDAERFLGVGLGAAEDCGTKISKQPPESE